MDRAGALSILNAKLLAAFSARTVDALRRAAPLRMALPYIEPVLALNVAKEARKDALVIRHAASAAAAGEPAPRGSVVALFADTKAIGDDFLVRTEDMPLRVVIRYEEIEPLRTKRIRYVLDTAYRICVAWQQSDCLRDALRSAYERADFEMVLCIILDLYAQETRVLSRSVRLPSVLAPLRDRAAKHLAGVMSEAGTRVASELARGVYRH